MSVMEGNLRRLVEENLNPPTNPRRKLERYRRLQREIAALEAGGAFDLLAVRGASHAQQVLQPGRRGAAHLEVDAFAHAHFGAAAEDGAQGEHRLRAQQDVALDPDEA